ncbi:MAG: DUF4418 family protein [Coriobacteriales bacterium]|jgi:hypothetical protein|nr:DUF4418 family protein [Coriobacteriales bacterium]
MKQKAWAVTAGLMAAAMLAIAAAAVFLGPCTGTLELANGGAAPMKCHWTYRAVTALALAGAVFAAYSGTLSTKEGRRTAAVAQALSAVLIALLPLFVIGTCADEAMQCNVTKVYVLALVAVVLVIAAVQFVKADPEKEDLPKARV